MITNLEALMRARPVEPMTDRKQRAHGVTWGLSEAGYDIRIKQSLWLHPLRRFRLASTVERFQMPRHLVGVVHDKSTWARRGLSVFNTVIEPGWEGWLTLELVYHGLRPLKIPAGAGIAQVIFHELAMQAAYVGRYQDAPDRPQVAKEAS